MLGSIFVGLSGMNAFSNGLRQISNNITNINSTGFKSSSLVFTDVFGAGAHTGGQIGHGVSLADPRLNFAQGELRQSTRDLDLSIDGAGFLVLLRDGERFYTRTGSFEIDAKGHVALSSDSNYHLALLGDGASLSAANIDAHRTSAPKATTKVAFSDNLSSTATIFDVPAFKVFNAAGESDNWQVRFERITTGAAGQWRVIVRNSQGAEVGTETLRFIGNIVDPTTRTLSFEDETKGLAITFDFSGRVESFSSGDVSTLRATPDGYGAGEITGMTVNEAGVLEISYSNEQKHALGAVALANFRDPQVLEQRDGGVFAATTAAAPDYWTSTHEGVGRVLSRRLEASNVDLSREFGDLILVQRGFQASSQVVSVSNDMIQQLFGMRGQG